MLRRLAISGLFVTACVFGNIGAAADQTTLETKLSKLGYAQGEKVDSIHDYRVDAWNYLDDQHIMLYTGPSRRALISVRPPCPELSSVEHIGFSTTARNLTKFDKIVLRAAGGIPRDCQISEIHELTKIKKE